MYLLYVVATIGLSWGMWIAGIAVEMKRTVLLFRLSLYAHPSNGPCRRNTDSFSPRVTLCISRGIILLARNVPVMYVFNV
jgi:hypothetical protein